jgi:hypothetical protein
MQRGAEDSAAAADYFSKIAKMGLGLDCRMMLGRGIAYDA